MRELDALDLYSRLEDIEAAEDKAQREVLPVVRTLIKAELENVTDPTERRLIAAEAERRAVELAAPRLAVLRVCGVGLPHTATASMVQEHVGRPLAARIAAARADSAVAQHRMPRLEMRIGAQIDSGEERGVLHMFARGAGLNGLANKKGALSLGEVHRAMASDYSNKPMALARWALLALNVYVDTDPSAIKEIPDDMEDIALKLGERLKASPDAAPDVFLLKDTPEAWLIDAFVTRFDPVHKSKRGFLLDLITTLIGMAYVSADAVYELDNNLARDLLNLVNTGTSDLGPKVRILQFCFFVSLFVFRVAAPTSRSLSFHSPHTYPFLCIFSVPFPPPSLARSGCQRHRNTETP